MRIGAAYPDTVERSGDTAGEDPEIGHRGLERKPCQVAARRALSGCARPCPSGTRRSRARPPLWSFRQHVEVRRTLSEAIGWRHRSLMPSSSHFTCCTVASEPPRVPRGGAPSLEWRVPSPNSGRGWRRRRGARASDHRRSRSAPCTRVLRTAAGRRRRRRGRAHVHRSRHGGAEHRNGLRGRSKNPRATLIATPACPTTRASKTLGTDYRPASRRRSRGCTWPSRTVTRVRFSGKPSCQTRTS